MKLEHVRFAYGDRLVMDGFSLALPDDGITALSGPSGCGKTTLLRLLAGLEKPQAGVVSAPHPAQIAVLFQENRLLPGQSCAGQLRAVLPRGADVQPWLELVELGSEANSPVSSLSGGMQRRLALARCMAYGADKALLLLDEPFTGVDSPRIARLMEALRQLDAAIVYAAHDAASLALADRVVRLDGAPLRVLEA